MQFQNQNIYFEIVLKIFTTRVSERYFESYAFKDIFRNYHDTIWIGMAINREITVSAFEVIKELCKTKKNFIVLKYM